MWAGATTTTVNYDVGLGSVWNRASHIFLGTFSKDFLWCVLAQIITL
jgi:hypothetical protein